MDPPSPLTESAISFPSSPTLPPSNLGKLPPPWRHAHYYIEDEMVIFLVERHLFKVHRYFFERESEIFRGMYLHPPAGNVEGKTDETAIALPGVTKKEFESLLDFIYYRMNENNGPGRTRLEQWMSLLSISSRFFFDKIRERAILEIERAYPRIDPVDKIVLAKKHDVPQWLLTAYCDICQRDEPLDMSEAQKVGLETTVLLWHAWQRVRQESDARSRNGFFEPAPSPYYERVKSPELLQPVHRFDTTMVSDVVTSVFFPPELKVLE